MSLSTYLAFCGLCVMLTVTPGPDSFLALRYSLRRRGAGFAAAAGTSLGHLCWAVLVGVGLAALFEQSAEAYRGLKLLGGLYLIYLGFQSFRSATGPDGRPHLDEGAVRQPALPAFGAGWLSCMLNPKVGLFFLAVVPSFLPREGSVLAATMLLGVTLSVIVVAYLSALCLLAAKANAWLSRPRVSRNLERGSGGVLVALGAGTAASAVRP